MHNYKLPLNPSLLTQYGTLAKYFRGTQAQGMCGRIDVRMKDWIDMSTDGGLEGCREADGYLHTALQALQALLG